MWLKNLRLRKGDEITLSMMPPKVTGRSDLYASVTLKVVGVVDAWPGYAKYDYEIEEESGKVKEKRATLL